MSPAREADPPARYHLLSHGWESAMGAVIDGGGNNWGATQEDSGFRMKDYKRKPDQEGGERHSR